MFKVGSTDILVHCVAQDGTAVTYTITVERKAQVITEPSVNSEPDGNSGGNAITVFAISAVSVAAITAVIIFVIYRKGKNNVQKDL
jgi:hypothetical protein